MKRNLSLGAALLAFALTPLLSQTAAGPVGHVHGHVTNPVGTSQSSGTVSLSTDGGRTPKFSFPVDSNGDYKGDAAPGTYTLVFRNTDTPADKVVDSFDNVKVESAVDTLQDVDMSRKAFTDKMTPEQQKALEDLKKKNAAALQNNAMVKNLNGDIRTAVQDIKDADAAAATARQQLGASAAKADVDAKVAEIKKAKYTEIESIMLRDTQSKPDASILWAQLGQAQAGLKKWDDATTAFKKGLELESASKTPKPEIEGLCESGLGEVYARNGKVQDAQDAYDAAAKANPAQAGFYYRNESVIFNQSNQPDAQVVAADKAIAADPSVALVYYLKGNGLVQKTTMDDKTHKLVAPPGCLEAYQKYLQLAPDGPYATEVKGILTGFDQTVDTSYKAKKK